MFLLLCLFVHYVIAEEAGIANFYQGFLRSPENLTKPDYSYFDEDEERLLEHLFQGYNHLIRPVPSEFSPPIYVDFGVAMILLISVDEKNQILQTNVWLTMKWNDFQLRWNPADFGNLSELHVPSEKVWLPEIVLFNNADGTYEVSFKSNVFIEHTGDVTWVPPARYLSSCAIDVEWFPFDEQHCDMIFGSWTYNKHEVQLRFYNNVTAVQLNDYSKSAIWDVIDVPGAIVNNGTTSRIVFNIHIRRKALFYTVILIIPTVLMAFLSMMAFYLPADSAEKISLTINIQLALVVFLVLVSKILPPTSNIPLMGKYLLMAFILNITTVIVTVIIVNIYFRSPLSHKMSPWVRKVFLEFLPPLLMMKRPERIPIFNGYFVEEYSASEIFDASLVMPSVTATIVPFINMPGVTQKDDEMNHHRNCSKRQSMKKGGKDSNGKPLKMDPLNPESMAERMSRELKRTVESIAYIAEHMKADMANKKIRDDWKYVAMVIDRLLLLVFFGVTLGGTIEIILRAPHVFEWIDQDQIIKELTAKPVKNQSDIIQVRFSLALILLINVDEKNQVMQTNVWPTMRWLDYQLRWDPRDYDNIGTIRVPPQKVWLPDIVLFNNADGNYLVSFLSNVVIEHTGEILWVPPAVFFSSCTIDVEYFPFDEQVCTMVFGSWTFGKDEVQIDYLMGKKQVDLNDYSKSGIWDLIDVPGFLQNERSRIAFQIKIRRKTLFYTVILIMPTVLMAFLSMMVFYLPAEASEKITLAISILLALVVFLLLISKILPPTSDSVPLMGKYLLITFTMNVIAIMVTVVIINVYFRGPATHTMAPWIRKLFINHLPLILMMKRPWTTEDELERLRQQKTEMRSKNRLRSQIEQVARASNGDVGMPVIQTDPISDEHRSSIGQPYADGLGSEAIKAIDAIEYITEHLRTNNDQKRMKEEWRFVATVLDRLLLYIFFAVTVGGTVGIICSAPNVFEFINQTQIIEELQMKANKEILDYTTKLNKN
ncbi:unnamed protein product, partial [Mesorhabditis belari]|uniref:Uncharacterized protein n=1 Tax=Mesorhabditis belari TaxID=2138241 RepID=A0AAF3EVE5_9BILA